MVWAACAVSLGGKNGTTRATLYFAIKNIATARVLAGAALAPPPPQVDAFGNPLSWVEIKFATPQLLTCVQMLAVFKSLVFLWSIYSFGDTPPEMWNGGLSVPLS